MRYPDRMCTHCQQYSFYPQHWSYILSYYDNRAAGNVVQIIQDASVRGNDMVIYYMHNKYYF